MCVCGGGGEERGGEVTEREREGGLEGKKYPVDYFHLSDRRSLLAAIYHRIIMTMCFVFPSASAN